MRFSSTSSPTDDGARNTPRSRARLAAALSLLWLAAVAWSSPIPLSPGSADEVAVVTTGCPTFNWALRSLDEPLELLVYRVDERFVSDAPAAEVVLRRELPAGSSGWTPDAGDCLSPGLYAWIARSLDGGPEPPHLLFEVAEAPSDLDTAARHLRSYLDHGGSLDELLGHLEDEERAGGIEPEDHPLVVEEDPPPLQKLGGTGAAIVAGSYRYYEPRTFTLTVPGFAFQAQDTDDWNKFGYLYAWADHNITYDNLRAVLNLPNGARVTKITCYHYDNDPDDSAIWNTHLSLRPHDGYTLQPLGTVKYNSAGAEDTIVEASTTSLQNHLVNNSYYVYNLSLNYNHDYGTSCCTQYLQFHGCKLDYTLTELRP